MKSDLLSADHSAVYRTSSLISRTRSIWLSFWNDGVVALNQTSDKSAGYRADSHWDAFTAYYASWLVPHKKQ